MKHLALLVSLAVVSPSWATAIGGGAVGANRGLSSTGTKTQDLEPLVAIPTPTVYLSMDSADIANSQVTDLIHVNDGVMNPPGGNGLSAPTSDSPAVVATYSGHTGLHLTSSKSNFVGLANIINPGTGNFSFFGHASFDIVGAFFPWSARNSNLDGLEISLGTGIDLSGRHTPTSEFHDFICGSFAYGDNALHDYGLSASRVSSDLMRCFADGNPQGSVDITSVHGTNLANTGAAQYIGPRITAPSTVYVTGTIGEWAYWNSVLTPSQFRTLHLLRLRGISLKKYLGLS